MGTDFNGVTDEDVGIIPRAVQDIIFHIDELEDEYKLSITCSFVEPYQSSFFDLFFTNKRDKATMDIRETENRIVLTGFTKLRVNFAREVTNHLIRGSDGRAAIAMVSNNLKGRKVVTTSKFNIVDLAVSERCSMTLANVERFEEGSTSKNACWSSEIR